jgi:hypothetical protein
MGRELDDTPPSKSNIEDYESYIEEFFEKGEKLLLQNKFKESV